MAAILQTLIFFVFFMFMATAYLGYGRVAAYILRIAKPTPNSTIMSIWLGWAFSLLILQITHLIFPVTALVAIPLFTVGVILAIPQIHLAFRHSFKNSAFGFWIFSVIIFLVMAVWVASRSMLPPTNGDSGLYHFNSIRWINSFPIVPGLGNLHGRLAFNQSFFIYVAALNFYPYLEYGRSLANSFLLLMTLATILHTLYPVFQRPSLLAESHPLQYFSNLMLLPILGHLALFSNGIASPTPDLAASLLQIAMFAMIAPGIAEWIKGERKQGDKAVAVAALAAIAITIKLSNLAFSVVILTFCLVCAFRTLGSSIQVICRVLLPGCLVLLVWVIRGLILSGTPLYPSTIGYMHFDWAMPIEKVVDEANWVYSWARQPWPHWSNVLGSREWIGPWSLRISKDIVSIVYPLALSAVFCIVAFIIIGLSFLAKGILPRYLDWSIILPSIIGLLFWFFTAPDPRFAHALFWLLSLSSALLLLSSIQPFLKIRGVLVAICLVFIATNLHFAVHAFNNRYRLQLVSGLLPIQTVPLLQKQTCSGLVVYTPESGEKCWDSPLPCTPYFNSALRQRIPGKLGSGFTLINAAR